jgi:hypothetical protein
MPENVTSKLKMLKLFKISKFKVFFYILVFGVNSNSFMVSVRNKKVLVLFS